jgi:hypothetical protein
MTDGVTTSSFEKQPFSTSEIATGGAALAAVLLVTFIGLRASQPDDRLSAAPVPAASLPAASVASAPPDTSIPRNESNESNESKNEFKNESKNQLRVESTASIETPPSEPSDRGVVIREPQPSSAPWQAVEPTSPNPGGLRPPTFPTESAKETADTALSLPDTALNPQNPSDAIWLQARLGDLGYFSANRTGVWGPASRNALRDFKSMNGLQEDDRWDRETEQRLSSRQVIPAAKTFIGGWAEDADQCGNGRDHNAPIVISSRAAIAVGGGCDFRSVKQEAPAQWRVQATCSRGGNSWNANVNLKLTAPNLVWSSERGIRTYVRCTKAERDGGGPVQHQVSRGTELARVFRDWVNRIPISADHP